MLGSISWGSLPSGLAAATLTLALCLLKMFRWGKAQQLALEAVCAVIEALDATEVKAAVENVWRFEAADVEAAVDDAAAVVDLKKSPPGFVEKVVREVLSSRSESIRR